MEFIERLSNDGGKKLSPNTIQKHYAFLHAMLEKAVQWQFIKDNPAAHIDKPKRTKAPMEILDTKECQVIIEALEQEDAKHKALVTLTIFTGMRRGEIFGLQWKHIDVNEKTVTIEQECQYNVGIGNHIVPRTKGGSARTISIHSSIKRISGFVNHSQDVTIISYFLKKPFFDLFISAIFCYNTG